MKSLAYFDRVPISKLPLSICTALVGKTVMVDGALNPEEHAQVIGTSTDECAIVVSHTELRRVLADRPDLLGHLITPKTKMAAYATFSAESIRITDGSRSFGELHPQIRNYFGI